MIPEANANARLETFCDGVFAIALTLLILEIKVPSPERIGTTRELWLALRHMAPAISAFVLSFVIILITWVNHHEAFRLVSRSSASFIYANGFLLLTVVIMPFPTALVGEYILTDHAAPAVVVFNAVTAVQAVGWILEQFPVVRSTAAMVLLSPEVPWRRIHSICANASCGPGTRGWTPRASPRNTRSAARGCTGWCSGDERRARSPRASKRSFGRACWPATKRGSRR
jgi:uncharacterized membrane protein